VPMPVAFDCFGFTLAGFSYHGLPQILSLCCADHGSLFHASASHIPPSLVIYDHLSLFSNRTSPFDDHRSLFSCRRSQFDEYRAPFSVPTPPFDGYRAPFFIHT